MPFFFGIKEEVKAYPVHALDFAKRVRVFNGEDILGNEDVTLTMALKNYWHIARSALKHGRHDVFVEVTADWAKYIIDVYNGDVEDNKEWI